KAYRAHTQNGRANRNELKQIGPTGIVGTDLEKKNDRYEHRKGQQHGPNAVPQESMERLNLNFGVVSQGRRYQQLQRRYADRRDNIFLRGWCLVQDHKMIDDGGDVGRGSNRQILEGQQSK